MYYVAADGRFCGLFKNRGAAERWAAELRTYPIDWFHPPEVSDSNIVLSQLRGRAGEGDLSRWISAGWTGRVKN